MFTAYIMFGGRIESYLNPELHFNLIEACHQIQYLNCAFSGVTGLWVLLCRRADNKRKDYSVFAYFCLKTVKHVNPPAVWWFQKEASFLLLFTLAKISNFSFLQASNVVTHNDLDEILKSLV